MVSEERQPSFHGIWISWGSPDPSRDTPFRDVETQFEQFAVNARCSPGRILGNHAEDQGANLCADSLAWTRSFSTQPRTTCAGQSIDGEVVAKTRSSRERQALTIQPRKCRSDAIISKNLSGKVQSKLCAKSFILQVYDVLASHTIVCGYVIERQLRIGSCRIFCKHKPTCRVLIRSVASWILGSEEARLRAGLRPPPKLPVHISCRQLHGRLSDARMREKELNRVVEQARTRRRANLGPTILLTNRVSNLHGAPNLLSISLRPRDTNGSNGSIRPLPFA
jgi:hypothetical protein